MIVPEPKLIFSDPQVKSKPQPVGDFRLVRVNEYFRSMELSANSIRAYRRSLSRFLGWTDKGWHILKHQDLDRYKEYLKELKLSNATIGERSGHKGTRTSLIADKRGKQLLALVLFQGSTNALWFNQWLEEHLVPELKPNSTLILDNAPFHRQDDVFKIAEKSGHKVLFLPPYSPDFNRIEQDFAIIKKRRIYSPPGTTLDDIVKSYGNYLE